MNYITSWEFRKIERKTKKKCLTFRNKVPHLLQWRLSLMYFFLFYSLLFYSSISRHLFLALVPPGSTSITSRVTSPFEQLLQRPVRGCARPAPKGRLQLPVSRQRSNLRYLTLMPMRGCHRGTARRLSDTPFQAYDSPVAILLILLWSISCFVLMISGARD